MKIVLFNEITWKNIIDLYRPQMTMWHRHIARWISKATDTYTQGASYLLVFHGNNGCMNVPQCCVDTYIAFLVVCCVCDSMGTDKHRCQCLVEEFDGGIL